MKLWRSFLEILQVPLKIIFLGIILYGIGNLIINPAFSSLYVIKNQNIILIAELLMRIGSFIIAYSPFIILVRSVARKSNAGTTILSGFIAYISFLASTIFFFNKTVASSAYTSIFNLAVTSSLLDNIQGTSYPIQTGLFGVAITIFLTRISYSQSRSKSAYSFFSYVDKDIYAVILNIVYSIIAGIGFSLIYPIYYEYINKVITFIANDITNPMSLFIYGIFDRLTTTFQLSNLFKNAFWFQATGGTWANIVGESVTGDVSIWTMSLASNQLQLSAGKFITPYYVLNIFAIPAMIWAIFSIYTDRFEKRKLISFFIFASLVSIFCGTLFPLELLLLFLCPLLYLFHLIYTGALFAIFQVLGVSLGFNYTGTSTIIAMPGTLMELLTYLKIPALEKSIQYILIVGVISALIYFIFTRFYFNYLAADLFNTGTSKRLVEGTIKAIGGVSNIKMIQTSISSLSIQVFDTSLVDADALYDLGATKITNTRAGIAIQYGAASTLVGKSINKSIRKSLRG